MYVCHSSARAVHHHMWYVAELSPGLLSVGMTLTYHWFFLHFISTTDTEWCTELS